MVSSDSPKASSGDGRRKKRLKAPEAPTGGANRWAVLPEGQLKYRLDGLGVILR